MKAEFILLSLLFVFPTIVSSSVFATPLDTKNISRKEINEWNKLWVELDKKPGRILISCYMNISNKLYSDIRGKITDNELFTKAYLSTKGAYGITE